MAVNDVVNGGNAKRAICLMQGLTAANAAPALATDGIGNYPTNKIVADDGACFTACPAMSSTLMVDLAGTTPTVTLVLWGYLAASGKWYPVKVNAGANISGVAAYAERFLDLGHYDRLYLQASAVTGTTPAVSAWLATSRTVAF